MVHVVLNVDDNEIGRYTRTKLLTRVGFHVLEAADGPEVLRIAREQKPDLVLLDVNLPTMNGMDVCRELRNDPQTARIPVIFLTASCLADSNVVEGLEAGGDNYLREPVDPTVLVATIRALLRAREAEDALARSNEQLSRFAFMVSHELQEPLRIVKNYSQLLARKYRGQIDSDAEEYVNQTVRSVDRMENFIRDMLMYSRMADTNLEVKPTRLEVPVQMALIELEVSIRETSATVHYRPMPVVGIDSMRLAQVFRNLIGNAIKYRAAEAPLINISAQERRSDFLVSVRDNGIGIDPAYAESIFVLFKRLHGRDTPGTGVGLALCKQIVEQHGGKIWVESQPGAGSDFRFTLPKLNGD